MMHSCNWKPSYRWMSPLVADKIKDVALDVALGLAAAGTLVYIFTLVF